MNQVQTASATVKYLPYLVAATFFMEYLDTTVLATALPSMARSFGVEPNALSIGMTAYMLALAVFIPISGWVADRFGARTVYGSAIVVFTGASLLCGASQGLVEFTAARVLQGVGGAMMVPVGRLIVARSVDKTQLMKAIATITWPAIAAPVVGPPIGGFITTYASWRWIFVLNVPFGIAAFAVTLALVRNVKISERRPLDYMGFLLSAATLICGLYGTELASDRHASLVVALGLVAAAIVLGMVAVRHASKQRFPLLDYTTLRVPTFAVTVVSGSLTRVGMGAVPYLMPLLFQIGFGLSAFRSGLILLASAVGSLGMKTLTTRILRRFGFRTTAIVDVAIGGVAITACGWLSPDTSLWVVLPVVIAYGVTRSVQYSALATLAYVDIPAQQLSSANTLWNAAAQLTIGLGIAVGAVSLRAATSLGGVSGHVMTLIAFRWAFLAAGVLTLLSLVGYFRLSPDAGAHLR